MSSAIIECVPNFSEGRRRDVVAAIADAAASAATVLHTTADTDHNRSVVTIAGTPDEVKEAAFRAAAKAVELIDMTAQSGVHPRIGAVDVMPFVPVEQTTLDQCAAIAVEVGERIWRELGVPIYLYEAAARRPERKNLENIRRGQFSKLREEVGILPERDPDIGEARLHPTAGAAVVGARKFLIAYNINLATPDVEVAKRIAKKIRASSGGFPSVKALGVMLESRGVAQVTMNLTDYEVTPMHVVFDAVRDAALAEGVHILGSEIIGLVPRRALEMAASHYLKIENFTHDVTLESRLGRSKPL